MSAEKTPPRSSLDQTTLSTNKAESIQDPELSGAKRNNESTITPEKPEFDPTEIEYPEGGSRGWWVAATSSGVLFATFGYGNAFGVLQQHYQSHQLQSSTPSQIAWIGSIQLWFLFSAMVFGGPLFDQYGAIFFTPSAIAYVFSVMMTSLSTKYWHFMLSQGVLGGMAMGMTMAPCMASIGHYFNKKRGAAMGLAIAGSSLGGVMFPLALGKMLNNPSLSFGWTIRILGFIMITLLIPACFAIRPRLPPRKGKFLIWAAFKEIQFTTIALSSFLMMIGIFMPFFFLPSFAVERGMDPQLASYLVGILNAASFFGRVIPGVLGDKLGRLNVLFVAGVASAILIFCFETLNSNATIIVFSIVYGFFQGAIISSMSVAISVIPKDQRDMGTYMGMAFGVMSIAVLIGPPINGAFITRYNSYDEVSYFGGSFALVGAFGIMFAKYVGKGIVAIE